MVPIIVLIAVVTGNSPIPRPTLQNVAQALEMKKPVGSCVSLQSFQGVYLSDADPSRRKAWRFGDGSNFHTVASWYSVSLYSLTIGIQISQVVTLILSPDNAHDPVKH